MSNQLTIGPSLIDRVVPRTLVNDSVLVLGMAVFTAVAAQIAIPMWPVPITAQTFAVLLAGAVLGAFRGALSMVVYVALGAAGLPVFAGWSAGLSFGTTFGYQIGFIAAAGVVGWLAQLNWQRKALGVAASFAVGNSVIYLFGLPWLGFVLGNLGLANNFMAVLLAGFVPFIIGDVVKMALAAAVLPWAWKKFK